MSNNNNNNGNNIINPLHTLDEILNWNKDKESDDIYSIKLDTNRLWDRNNINNNNNNNLKDIKRMKVIHCHDMMGGYKYDNNAYGRSGKHMNIFNESYNFAYWHLIDIFIYFSHSLLTIPTHQWINCAHQNGVIVLGTFIVEWEQGSRILDELTSSKEFIDQIVKQMIRIAKYYKFDGWFINIESKLNHPSPQLPLMLYFVKQLTKAMHLEQAESMIIWYDSLTSDGLIRWQNKLNQKNKLFFDICDGIFTNYTWKKSDPLHSMQIAGDRKYDVYTGIDLFGRGSYGGGGFDGVMKALDVIKNAETSIALFAPAWTFEHCSNCGECGRMKYEQIESKLWDAKVLSNDHSIIDYVEPRYLSFHLPFVNNFNRGVGKYIFKDGQCIKDDEWYLQSSQDITSSLQLCNIIEILDNSYSLHKCYNISYCYDFAWCGGSCLQIEAKSEQQAYIELFRFNDKYLKDDEKSSLENNNNIFQLSIHIKCEKQTCWSMLIKMLDSNQYNIIECIGDVPPKSNHKNNCKRIKYENYVTYENNDWVEYQYKIKAQRIQSINIDCDNKIWIGQIKIT